MKTHAILLGLALSAPAFAQGISALQGHDTGAPIELDAARAEVSDRENQAVFSGGVHVTQSRLTLDANQIRVFYDRSRSGDPQIRRLDAEGGVRLTSPSERASGRYGIYDVDSRQITLIGDVVLNQNQSVLKGQRLAIDLDSGRSTLDGATGRGVTGSTGGRVTGRFVVPPRGQTP